MDNKDINKMRLQVNNGITPSREDLEALLNESAKVSSAFIKKEREHLGSLDVYIGSRTDDYDILSSICDYINSQLVDIESALKGDPTNKTYGYILDGLAVTTKRFSAESKKVTKEHISITDAYTRFDFWDFSHLITDFEKELSGWVCDMKETVSVLSRAIGRKDTFTIYKCNEDLTALRSNSKYLKFWLEDNMPTQR